MERTRLIPLGALAPEEAANAPLEAVGGKAAGLVRLSAGGLNVPPWFVVPAEVAKAWLEDTDETITARLVSAFEGWTQLPFAGLAIRSSAPSEDASASSQAGRFDTAFVRATDDLAHTLRRVAMSSNTGTPIPLVVQALVNPDAAGVAFSGNPSGALPRVVLVEAVLGHGADLVDGSRTPLQFRIDLEDAVPAGEANAVGLAREIGATTNEIIPGLDAALDDTEPAQHLHSVAWREGQDRWKNHPMKRHFRAHLETNATQSAAIAHVVDVAQGALSRNENRGVLYRTIATEEAALIRGRTGLDLTGFGHSLDSYAVRHAIREHGDATKEDRRGQEAILREDFLKVPLVTRPENLVAHEKNARGQDLLIYKKRFNGHLIVVVERRCGHTQLALSSIRKSKSGDAHSGDTLTKAQVSQRPKRPGARPPLEFTLPQEAKDGKAVPGSLLVSEVSINLLARTLLTIEALFGCAVDVEWCVRDSTLYILQARPITAMSLDASLLPDEPMSSWFFDQRFPDPISPFARDTLLRVVADVALKDALRMRGAPVPRQLIHYHAGRAYTPLRLLDTMLRGAPRWWLSADLRQIFGERGRASGGFFAMWHYAFCAAYTVLANFGDVFLNTRAWARFERELPRQLAAIPERADDWQGFEKAWHACDSLMRRFLQIHRWSILWADYGYRALSLLKQVLPAGAAVYIDKRLAECIHLPTAEANAALHAWQQNPNAETRAALMDRFGDRSASLDYAVPTWRELYGGNFDHDVAQPPPAVQRSPRPWFPLSLLARLLEMREAQRPNWEHILAKQRGLALHLADKLVDEGLLSSREDIWLLNWTELHALATDSPAQAFPSSCHPQASSLVGVHDAASKTPTSEDACRWHEDLKRELRLRRHEQFLFGAIHPPSLLSPEDIDAPSASADTLKGLGASAGVVEGRALHVPNPAAPPVIPSGSILILRALDPACTGIMRQAAGLVVERGGLLSHAAILAREYRVPLVIGVEDAMAAIAAGEHLRIDGARGTITRVE